MNNIYERYVIYIFLLGKLFIVNFVKFDVNYKKFEY